MDTSSKMKKIYTDIQEKLYYMIPEKWDSIFLYASIFKGINNIEMGEMFFYYFPKGILKKEPINVYEIPNKFNLDEDEYYKLVEALYEKIKKLKEEFIKVNKKNWTNVTISINNYKFMIEYDYEDLKSSEYNSYERHIIWRYIYLKTGINTYSKKERKIINSYLEKCRNSGKVIDRYVEGVYNNGVHNVINYNKEEKENVEDEEEEYLPSPQSIKLKKMEEFLKNKQIVKSEEKTTKDNENKNSTNQILRY